MRLRILCWTLTGLLSASAFGQPTQATDPAADPAAKAAGSPRPLAELLPRVPAQEPSQALQSFSTLLGFKLELAACEPTVVDPVDAAFDEDGRLWVAEMRGYPYPEEGPKLGRVRRLVDQNDDGVFDDSVVVADGLPWPTGIAVYEGGCFVIAPPDLWYLKDTTGDGVADIRERVWTGFEKSNVQALANNLRWGLDGRIYGVSASNGGTLRRVDDAKSPAVSIQGRDFAFDPKTRQLQAIAGTMQFGQSFDDWYDRFVCGNSNHAMHVVFDDRYLGRSRHLSAPRLVVDIPREGGAGPVFRRSQAEPWRVVRTARRAESGQSFSTAELHATGYFTSASGVTIYRGDAYPAPFRGNLFVGDVGGNLIHRKTLAESSATFEAVRADEGAEFVTSTDNWFRPVNFVNAPDGCLYVLDMYRETIEHPWSIPEDIKAHLDLESGRDRGRVYRLAPPNWQRRPTPRLSQCSIEELVQWLGHPNAWHRESAQRLLLERGGPAVREALAQAKVDLARGEPRQVLHVASIRHQLGGLTSADYLALLRHPEHRLREQAIRWVEERMAEDDALAQRTLELLADESFRVRWQAALSVGALPATRRLEPLARLAREGGSDGWMRWAILCSSADMPGPMLAAVWKSKEAIDPALVEGWVSLVAAQRTSSELKVLLEGVVEQPIEARRRVLAALGNALGIDRASALLAEAVAGGPAESMLRETLAAHRALVGEASADPAERVRAIESLAADPQPDWSALARLLGGREPREVQLAALSMLSRSTSPMVGPLIVEAWGETTPSLRSELLEVMLARPDRQRSLVGAIENGTVLASQLTSSARSRLLASSNQDLVARTQKVLSALTGNRSATVKKYQESLGSTPTDLKIGQKVFERECATCHKLRGVGHEVGPNLATIAGRSPAQLVQNILDPNVEVLPSFVEVSMVLNDGRVATGIIVAENANRVTLRRAEGVGQEIARDAIDEIQSTGKSLMPEGLEQKISPEEMAHLIGYLLDATDTSKITGKR
jgi:putative membrane-bound dehydrogenase-like protein